MGLNGNYVTGYDVCKPSLEFAESRKKWHRIGDVDFTDKLPDLKEFDFIVAIDVLEHIKDLRELLLKFGKEMKIGSQLYHCDSFNDLRATHFDHSKEVDAWFQEAGLRKTSEGWAIKE